MTSPTLERAARAAYESWIEDVPGLEPEWRHLPESHRARLIQSARAVLMAVREIDPAIHDKVTIGGWLDDEMKFSEAWHGGIDAILGVNQSNEP